jgi:hypothetical protein
MRGSKFSGFGFPALNDAGRVAFSAGIGPMIPIGVGVYTGDGGPLTLVASSEARAFGNLWNAAINDAGTVALRLGDK